jgi:protoporphyrinogen oxidase
MKVAVIGAGFGGLAAAYKLLKNGVEVDVYEADNKPGGLAVGFKEDKWRWTFEKHYHHWFTNDDAVLKLARDIGHNVVTIRPKTCTYFGGVIRQLDSPVSLLQFSVLPFGQRLRTGLVLAYLKLTPFWRPLEKVTAKEFLLKWMGEASWEVLWRPLFEKKFGDYADKISAAWFWARIKKRTPALAYPEGGFAAFADHLDEEIRGLGGATFYNTPVVSIRKQNKSKKFQVKTATETNEYNKVISTLPTPLFLKTTEGLPEKYVKEMTPLKGLGAINLVLSLNKAFFEDNTYWLNVNELDHPFLAVVEHTNFMNEKYYNREHLLYVGNYLPHDHEYFKKNEKELVDEFLPYLKKINPEFRLSFIKKAYLFKAPFAQPIIPLNYSKMIPDFKTPIQGLYLCNIQQVYPWDRGTNYAVANGEAVARLVIGEW